MTFTNACIYTTYRIQILSNKIEIHHGSRKTLSGYYIQYKILTAENTVGADKNTVVAVKHCQFIGVGLTMYILIHFLEYNQSLATQIKAKHTQQVAAATAVACCSSIDFFRCNDAHCMNLKSKHAMD